MQNPGPARAADKAEKKSKKEEEEEEWEGAEDDGLSPQQASGGLWPRRAGACSGSCGGADQTPPARSGRVTAHRQQHLQLQQCGASALRRAARLTRNRPLRLTATPPRPPAHHCSPTPLLQVESLLSVLCEETDIAEVELKMGGFKVGAGLGAGSRLRWSAQAATAAEDAVCADRRRKNAVWPLSC